MRLTLKRPGGGGNPPPRPNRPNCAIFRHRIWPVNIFKFKYVHPSHFATILRLILRPLGSCWTTKLLTHIGIFDQLILLDTIQEPL